MRIRGIYSPSFEPFGELEMEFPAVENPSALAEVHLFTGVNGTGKTRLLSLLAAGLGNGDALMARLGGEENVTVFAGDGLGTGSAREIQSHTGLSAGSFFRKQQDSKIFYFGRAVHGNYGINFQRDTLNKLPCFAYSGDAHLSDCGITPMQAVKVPAKKISLAFQKPTSSSKDLAQALSNLSLSAAQHIRNYGGYDEAKKRSRQFRLISYIEESMSRLAGRHISFEVVSQPSTMLMVNWGKKPLPFNLLPDGLRSILGWLVELAVVMDLTYPNEKNPWAQPLMVLLDEVECHLHPSWQRQVIPMAQRMFPQAQIFVATHSPFVIASVNEGWIHNFNINKDGLVSIDPPLKASEGDSYVQVLGAIMGVTELYDPETEELLSDYRELRTKALRKEPGMREQAITLADRISNRGTELAYMMSKEKAQMEKMLNGSH